MTLSDRVISTKIAGGLIPVEDVKEFIRELKKAWNDPTRLGSMDDWINNHAGDKLT